MKFGEVVGEVDYPGSPVYVKLLLLYSILEPIVAHVDTFGSVLFDGAVDDSIGGGIVCFHTCGWLRMAHFVEADSHWERSSGIHKKGCDFGFCDGRANIFDGFG